MAGAGGAGCIRLNFELKTKSKPPIIFSHNNKYQMKHLQTFLALCLILGAMTFYSCEKDDPCLNATVRFTNTSSSPYDLKVDGDFIQRLSGNTFTEVELFEGRRNVRLEQVSGFILFPTIVETTMSVFGCQEQELVFP